MNVLWRAISENEPGPKWVGLFHEYWPDYHKWWLQEGVHTRPTYLEGRRALEIHMPEIVPLYDELCEAAGGGDHAARFLSFYCPPPYLSGNPYCQAGSMIPFSRIWFRIWAAFSD